MEQGFPGAHVTNVAGTTTTVEPRFRYDPSYVRTLPGQLKIVQMILNLLGCIFITSSQYSYHGRAGYFNTIAMGGFWFTGILLVMYLFHIIEKFHGIPWLKIEFIFCTIWTGFYLIASALAADFMRNSMAYGIASLFGFCAMVAYGYDAWLKFNAVKNGELAQGQLASKQISTVTTPAY